MWEYVREGCVFPHFSLMNCIGFEADTRVASDYKLCDAHEGDRPAVQTMGMLDRRIAQARE